MVGFKERIEESSESKNSRIILALDVTGRTPERIRNTALNIVKRVAPYVCAVKLNLHILLPLNLFTEVSEILVEAHSRDLECIADCKLNDIGSTNLVAARYLTEAGFDAVTVNPFIGWEEGVQPIIGEIHDKSCGVLLLAYMSHRGAREGYGRMVIEDGGVQPFYKLFVRKALEWGCDGVVVGATRPAVIYEVYSMLGETIPIYAPGIGVQGGHIEAALKAGARYLIIGRSILSASDPEAEARRLRDLTNSILGSP